MSQKSRFPYPFSPSASKSSALKRPPFPINNNKNNAFNDHTEAPEAIIDQKDCNRKKGLQRHGGRGDVRPVSNPGGQ